MQNIGQPIEGSTRFRPIQQEGLLSTELRIQQSQAQYNAFRDFYFNELNGGEDWFFMDLLLGLSPVVLVCHIRDGFTTERNATVFDGQLTSFSLEALRKVSTPYMPVATDVIAPGGPDNPNLGTLDIIAPGGPDNPNLATLDVIYGGTLIGLPPL
jgi:hypothetical protein